MPETSFVAIRGSNHIKQTPRMSKPILYTDKRSPVVRSVLILIEELQLDLDYVEIDLFCGEQMSPGFLKVHSNWFPLYWYKSKQLDFFPFLLLLLWSNPRSIHCTQCRRWKTKILFSPIALPFWFILWRNSVDRATFCGRPKNHCDIKCWIACYISHPVCSERTAMPWWVVASATHINNIILIWAAIISISYKFIYSAEPNLHPETSSCSSRRACDEIEDGTWSFGNVFDRNEIFGQWSGWRWFDDSLKQS